MTSTMRFWLTDLARGVTALIAGMGILVLPGLAHNLLLLPLSIAVSVLILSGYGIVDSGLVLLSSVWAVSARSRIALVLQGLAGMTVGVLLIAVVYDRAKLEWFLTLISFQALTAGAAELVIATHAGQRSISRWNYAGAAIAFLFAALYLGLRVWAAEQLVPYEISWLIYVYLLAFGTAQCLTAGRMLYAACHPSALLGSGPLGGRA